MIELRDIVFAYGGNPFRLRVPDLRIPAGQHAALIGPSGSGKTTLIHLIAGILTPHAGLVRVGDFVVSRASAAARRRFRLTQIGLVFQEFELLEYLRVCDNIRLPYLLSGALRPSPALLTTVRELARAMGIGDKLRRFPRTLSQGERQRVALCRALITGPQLVIADEPTGNLDPRTADHILDLLLAETTRRGATLLMVTHNHGLLGRFERVIDVTRLAQGVDA